MSTGPAADSVMKYFAWCTDKPDSSELRMADIKPHWDFIAIYDDRLIARGPVLDVDDPAERAGHYAETRVHRWTLGGADNLKASGLVK